MVVVVVVVGVSPEVEVNVGVDAGDAFAPKSPAAPETRGFAGAGVTAAALVRPRAGQMPLSTPTSAPTRATVAAA